jgi:hypothetical protein
MHLYRRGELLFWRVFPRHVDHPGDDVCPLLNGVMDQYDQAETRDWVRLDLE